MWAVLAGLWVGCLLPGPAAMAAIGSLLVVAAAARRGQGGRFGGDARAEPTQSVKGSEHPPAEGAPGPQGLRPQVPVAEARSRWRLAVLVVGFVLLGSGTAGARFTLLERGPLHALAEQGGVAAVRGRVVSEARETRFGAWLLVRVSAVDGRPAASRALLRVDPESAPPLGAVVAAHVTARPLDRDGFDAYLRRLSAGTAMTATGPVRVVGAPPAALLGTTAVRERTRTAFRRRLPIEHAALLTGLVTGDVRGLPEEVAERLTAAGLSHLVAVSGSNVALVLAGAVAMAALCRLGARGRRRVCAGAVLWFVVLVRAEPSVLRAALMAAVVLAAQATGRGADVRHTLGVVAVLLLLVDPLLAGHLGFALSVLATAGVLVVTPAVAARVPGPRPLGLLVGASVGAQVGVAPVLFAVEGAVPLAALPANLVAVPAAAVASAVGVAAALVAQLSEPAGALLARLATPALAVILGAGRQFADGPRLHPGDLARTGAVLLAVAVLGVLGRRGSARTGAAVPGGRRSRRVAAGALAAVVVVALVPRWRGLPPVAVLTLTALDVGQGDALLVEAPGPDPSNPARMLVDGGPGPALALRLLRDRGLRRLDAVVISHPHADHTEGLPAVLDGLRVGALVVPPLVAEAAPDLTPSALTTLAVARRHGVPVVAAAAGSAFALGRAQVQVLSPPPHGSLGDEPNDNSLVLRVSDRGGSLLLAGDAEAAAQRRLLRRPDLLRATVLKVPHHGGDTNEPGFLDAVGAGVAVMSLGRGNDYGHPHPAVLADIAPVPLRRTDRDGTVRVPAGAPAADYTARDARPALPGPPAGGARGAASAPRSRPRPRRAAGGWDARRRRPPRRRPHRQRPSRPAHRVAVRRAARGPPA